MRHSVSVARGLSASSGREIACRQHQPLCVRSTHKRTISAVTVLPCRRDPMLLPSPRRVGHSASDWQRTCSRAPGPLLGIYRHFRGIGAPCGLLAAIHACGRDADAFLPTPSAGWMTCLGHRRLVSCRPLGSTAMSALAVPVSLPSSAVRFVLGRRRSVQRRSSPLKGPRGDNCTTGSAAAISRPQLSRESAESGARR